jgi:hypothetical protein
MRSRSLLLATTAAAGLATMGHSLAQAPPAPPPAAQPPAPPIFATRKVEGTENVYIFRYQNHQSMFVVTKAGVIATDPMYGPAVRRKKFRRSGFRSCINVSGL